MTADQCAPGPRPVVDFDDIEYLFNESAGAFIAQVRHMNDLNTPAMTRLLSVSKKTYLEMEKGKRQYRLHIINWWCFVMGMSPLHLLAQSNYFAHLPIGDYRNIRQVRLASLLQRVTPEDCLTTLKSMIDHCPRHIGRDADESVCINPSELAGVRPFFYDTDYYKMVAEGLLFFLRDNQLTRRDLARHLNVTPRTVRRILSGEVTLNFSYYARFYLSTGVYPLRILDDSPYLKIRLKQEQRLCLINDLIAGYASSPDVLDELLMSLANLPADKDWWRLFEY
ncbi:transcriptional regulator [Saccharospirillum impatiens]|uniref:transcriptional regulator n=1 Tax=Saccharospirillum impatiens TaxID=169438 RepID=UPI0004909DA2|nr:transcriptional regulator [Saccharospirillum impatiens]